MDSVDPNSNPIRPNRSPEKRPDFVKRLESSPPKASGAEGSTAVSAYADIFDDKELERLHNNLKSVSELASDALKRFKDDANK